MNEQSRMEYSGYEQDTIHNLNLDPLMDLLFMGWNPDLPDPVILNRLLVYSTCAKPFTEFPPVSMSSSAVIHAGPKFFTVLHLCIP